MTVKQVIKLFIPPFILRVIRFFLENKKKYGNYVSTISDIKKNTDKLIILGNGPSLKTTLKKHSEYLATIDTIAVNHFCETEYFETIKPKIYLLADPAFFGNIDSYADWLKKKISDFMEVFLGKISWNINLIVPDYAKDSYFIQQCNDNNFVSVFFYNTKDFVDSSTNKFKMWDLNKLSVPAQTCLNTCLYLGIFLRYKEIYLVGADTSWIELLHVDQENNEVYTIDSHFYGSVRRPLYSDIECKIPQKLYEELFSIGTALELYWKLREYADYAGVKVYNASEYSLIDAFDRKKLEGNK